MLGIGNINYITEKGAHMTGCTVKTFRAPWFCRNPNDLLGEQMLDFFSKDPNLLVVEIKPLSRREILVIYNKVVTQAELDEFNSVQAEARRLINERKAKVAEAEEKLEVEKVKKLAEEKELLELGRRCKEHHAALIDDNRRLRSEYDKLRKAAKKSLPS